MIYALIYVKVSMQIWINGARMSDKNYARMISKRAEAEAFCRNILFSDVDSVELDTTRKKEYHEAVKDILEQEQLLNMLTEEQSNTLNSKDNRVEDWRSDRKREDLRYSIAKNCLEEKRLPEEQITVDKGGMLPQTELQFDSQFYLVIGLPASGKSSVSEKLADLTGSVYLDADIVKRKLPEFSQDTRGASLVHLESNYILRPSIDFDKCPKYNIMLNCFQNKNEQNNKRLNVVYNMIGDNYEWLLSMIEMVRSKQYTVNLLLIELDRFKCVQRAYRRFKEKGRYLSLPLLFDVYANNPTVSFFKAIAGKKVESYAYIDNDVEVGAPKKVIINRFADKTIIDYIAKGDDNNGSNSNGNNN